MTLRYIFNGLRTFKREVSLAWHGWREGWLPLRHPFSLWMLMPGEVELSPNTDDKAPRPQAACDADYSQLSLSKAEFRLVPEMLKSFDFAFALLFATYGFIFLTAPSPLERFIFALIDPPQAVTEQEWIQLKTIDIMEFCIAVVKIAGRWLFSLMAGGVSWLSATVTFTSYGWMKENLGWLAAGWWLISATMLWLVAPVLLHVLVLRAKVLAQLNTTLPAAHREWFLGLPSEVVTTPVHDGNRWRRVGILTCKLLKSQIRVLQLPTSRDPTVWQPLSSGAAGLLSLSMADYFSPDRDGWRDASKATFRFLFAYCAPVWTSYIWLILTISLFRIPGPARTWLCFAWMAVAIFFLLWAVLRYGGKQRDSTAEHLQSLPIIPIWNIIGSPKDLWIIRERWVQILAGALPALGLGLALTAIQTLPADNSMCPYPRAVTGSAVAPLCPDGKK